MPTIEEFFHTAKSVKLTQSEKESLRMAICSGVMVSLPNHDKSKHITLRQAPSYAPLRWARQGDTENNVRATTQERHTSAMAPSPECFLASAQDCAMSSVEKDMIRHAVLEHAKMISAQEQTSAPLYKRDEDEESFIETILSWLSFIQHAFGMKGFSLAMSVIVLVGASGGLTFAAEGSLPGDFLYPVKINITEPIIETVLITSKSSADWEISKTKRRFQEISQLRQEGRLTEETASVVAIQVKQYAKKARDLSSDIAEKDNITAIAVTIRLEESLTLYEQRLKKIKNEEKIKPIITLAVAVKEEKEKTKTTLRKQTGQIVVAAIDSDQQKENKRPQHIRNNERETIRDENQDGRLGRTPTETPKDEPQIIIMEENNPAQKEQTVDTPVKNSDNEWLHENSGSTTIAFVEPPTPSRSFSPTFSSPEQNTSVASYINKPHIRSENKKTNQDEPQPEPSVIAIVEEADEPKEDPPKTLSDPEPTTKPATEEVTEEPKPKEPAPLFSAIIDNTSGGFWKNENWLEVQNGYGGTCLQSNKKNPTNATWSVSVTPGKHYEVYTTWPVAIEGVAMNSPFAVVNGQDTKLHFVNQQQPPVGFVYNGFSWHQLQTLKAETNTLSVKILANYPNESILADAILVREVEN